MATTYMDLMDGIEAYYGEGSDQWVKMASGTATNAERVQILKQVPGVTTTVNSKGQIIGWDYTKPFNSTYNPPAEIDSNVPNAIYGENSTAYNARINATYEVIDETIEPVKSTWSSGAKKVGTGAKVFTAAADVASVVCAAGLGAKLGKAINASFGGKYKWTDADWEDWVSGFGPVGQAVFRTLFDIDGDSTTAYLPEDMLASMYKMLYDMGAFNVSRNVLVDDVTIQTGAPIENFMWLLQDKPTSTTFPSTVPFNYLEGTELVSAKGDYSTTITCTRSVKWFNVRPDKSSGNGIILGPILISLEGPFTVTTKTLERGNPVSWASGTGESRKTTITIDGVPVDVWKSGTDSQGLGVNSEILPQTGNYTTGASYDDDIIKELVYILKKGTFSVKSGVDGMSSDPRATIQIDPSLITGTTPATILPQLKSNYPQLFDGSIYEDVPQEDGSNRRITYVPIPFPRINSKGNPITGVPSQGNPKVDPTTATGTDLDTLTDVITGSPTGTGNTSATPPATGSGNSPITAAPTGSASSLWAVYNPTQEQVNAFGAWLWDSNLVEQIKKLFSDPMQAIIGIHKVFATPETGAEQNIKCGYIDSGVPSKIVTNQYTTVNCGTVNLREYFGNVFDYSPYTEVSLYLPFIGIVKLDVADVMRSSITVKYHVDVITGACLADVIVSRDGYGGVLYQYSGSAIVTYPVSSGSYASALTGILSIAGGVATTIASGGALAPAAIGAAVGMSRLHTDVQKSGSFTGAAGAMGAKKPYLIISRPQTAMPSSYKHLEGQPASHYTRLGDTSGYVKVKSVMVNGISATDTELDMIQSLLMQGVDI